MKITIAPRARRDLSRQLQYLIDHDARSSARQLEQRLISFVENVLAAHPRTGAFLVHRDLWETWIPGTRLVL
jgi:plasmid stabilization system protein ParE